MERLEETARRFAVTAHGAQRYDGEPYVVHLDDVAWFSRPFGENAAALAYLHDVAEDTMFGVKEVRRAFGADMARWVGLLTDPEAPNRKARKEAANAKLAAVDEADFVVLIVKAADRLANVARCRRKRDSRLFEMYKREHDAFERAVRRSGVNDKLFDRLKVAFERPLHAVYVDPLCEACIFNNVGNPDFDSKCSCIWTHDDMRKLRAAVAKSENDVARQVAKSLREHFPLNTSACGWADWIDSGAWREKPGPCLGCDRNTVASCPVHDAPGIPDETKS
jgi:hypothetical protein